MKKFLSTILALAILIISTFTLVGCGDRSEVLKICNQGEYMDPDTYNGFVEWYKNKTGKNIKVQYKEFDTNETLYTYISRQKADYDLVCPSEYMIQRLISENLLQELDVETKTVVENAIDPFIVNKIKEVCDPDLKYTMPYAYGTLGILFDTTGSTYTMENMATWKRLFESTTKNIYMKDSVKDSYSAAMLYYYNYVYTGTPLTTDEVLQKVFTEISSEAIESAKSVLLNQKNNVCKYEVDDGKTEIYDGSGANNGKYGLFWSCDAGYIMLEEDGTYNDNFMYVVPDEGSNLWFDGFVIPKYAGNSEVANYFIQYLCEEDVASDCMEYIGTTTAVKAAADQYKTDLLSDENFLNTTTTFQDMYLKMLFPGDYNILNRCGIMKSFPDFNEALDDMWIHVTM